MSRGLLVAVGQVQEEVPEALDAELLQAASAVSAPTPPSEVTGASRPGAGPDRAAAPARVVLHAVAVREERRCRREPSGPEEFSLPPERPAVGSEEPAQEGDAARPRPDANSADPFIVAKAQELGNDPLAIFEFVRDEIGFESYQGSLRGARGALWSKAGNALDQASLLIALLRASNILARYARGTLPDNLVQELILSMFPEPLRVLGCLDPGIEVSDPANDPKLL